MSTQANSLQNLPRRVRWARILYGVCTLLFMLGIVLQVFFAGATLLVSGSYLIVHENVGHAIEFLIPLLIIIGLFARLPRRMHLLGVLLLVDFFFSSSS